MTDPQQAMCDPTEKTLYEEPHDDHWGTWKDRLYQCGDGIRKGIGISDGCIVYVRPLKVWHGLAGENEALKELVRHLQTHIAGGCSGCADRIESVHKKTLTPSKA